MDCTRIYTDTSGTSRFEVETVIMEEKTEYGFFSALKENVKYMYFYNLLPNKEWHLPGPEKQVYICVLDGTIEFEVSSGEKKTFTKGQVILLDDHSGDGHKVKTNQDVLTAMMVHMK